MPLPRRRRRQGRKVKGGGVVRTVDSGFQPTAFLGELFQPTPSPSPAEVMRLRHLGKSPKLIVYAPAAPPRAAPSSVSAQQGQCDSGDCLRLICISCSSTSPSPLPRNLRARRARGFVGSSVSPTRLLNKQAFPCLKYERCNQIYSSTQKILTGCPPCSRPQRCAR